MAEDLPGGDASTPFAGRCPLGKIILQRAIEIELPVIHQLQGGVRKQDLTQRRGDEE